jgi:Tol biopolymer transport system component
VSNDGPRDPEDRLDSWKAIATYLNRGVRTVQRWEQTDGLPVRRLSPDKKASVFAYRSELDAWWASRPPDAREEPSAEQAVAPEIPAVPHRQANLAVVASIAAGLILAAALVVFGALRRGSEFDAPRFATNAQFSSNDGLDLNAGFSPDGQLVTYASDRTGSFEIFVRTLSSGSEIQITSNEGQNLFPSFSPDGQTIAFSALNKPGIFVVSALGGSVRRLTDFGCQPAWSPDGSRLVFVSPVNFSLSTTDYYWPAVSSLWMVSARGDAAPRPITSRTSPPGGQTFPSWSPDGSEIRFVNYREATPSLWTYRVADGVLQKRFERPRLTTLGSATFSRDSRILYYIDSNSNGNIGVQALPLNPRTLAPEGRPETVFRPAIGVPRDLALSPDGRHLLYSAVLSHSRLMALPMKGDLPNGEPRQLTRVTGYRYAGPMWSPDSRLMLYTELLTGGPARTWVGSLDGASPRLVPGAAGSNQWFVGWSPDGRRIRFRSSDTEGRMEFDEVSLDDGLTRRLADARGTNFPDFSPDGKEVAYHDAQAAFQVWKLRLEDGTRTQLTFGDEPTGYPHYSPDGKWLSIERITASGTNVLLLPAGGGTPEPIWTEPGSWLPTGWSPDGDKVLIAGNPGGGWSVDALSRRTHRLQRLTPALPVRTYVRSPRWSPDGRWIGYELNESKGNVFLAELAGENVR